MTETQHELIVNGAAQLVPLQATVNDVVDLLLASSRGCAVALNGEVLSRGVWQDIRPATGDRIEILTAAPGG